MSLSTSNHWVASKTSRPSLTIGGTDYSSQMLTFTVSDDSAMKNGLVMTTGSISLASLGGSTGLQVEDYLKNKFKRGTVVLLDLTYWDSSSNTLITKRHPRGYLYVLGTSYDMIGEELTLEVGCKLALWSLNEEDNISLFEPFQQLVLDPDQVTIQNIGATLSAVGKFLWQNNEGNLVVTKYFGSDVYGTTESPKWVSIKGISAFEASPLRNATALPDDIQISYNVLDKNASQENLNAPTETISNYWLEYPAITYERTRIDTDDTGGSLGVFPPTTIQLPATGSGFNALADIQPLPPQPGGPGDNGCENVPVSPGDLNVTGTTPSVVPDGSGGAFTFPVITISPTSVSTYVSPGFCSYSYINVASAKIMSASSRDISYSEYNGPGGQVSFRRQERYGPAVELNNQYYADEYSYCQNTYGTSCNPSGNCALNGMEFVLQSFEETIYNYDSSDGSLLSEETSSYETTLSAAIPADWRSGITNGIADNFTYLSTNEMYRSTYRVVEYSRTGNLNVTKESLYTSAASEGGGLSGAAGISSQNVWQPYGTEVGTVA